MEPTDLKYISGNTWLTGKIHITFYQCNSPAKSSQNDKRYPRKLKFHNIGYNKKCVFDINIKDTGPPRKGNKITTQKAGTHFKYINL